jgi:RNA polymerase sigma-70 factor (ECF subfamily)
MADADPIDEQLRLLMRAVQEGDRAAYRALLTAITPRIRRFVRSRGGGPGRDDLEDVVQDVLLSVHTVLATYDPARPFMPWVLAIARHRMVDAARRRARVAREVAVENFDVTFADVSTNTDDEGPGDVEALLAAIRQLPAAQRQAIELLKLQQLSLKEAAAATGANPGALKVATHRAMQSLRRMLGAAPDDHADR